MKITVKIIILIAVTMLCLMSIKYSINSWKVSRIEHISKGLYDQKRYSDALFFIDRGLMVRPKNVTLWRLRCACQAMRLEYVRIAPYIHMYYVLNSDYQMSCRIVVDNNIDAIKEMWSTCLATKYIIGKGWGTLDREIKILDRMIEIYEEIYVS